VPEQMNPLEPLPTLIAATPLWEWTGWDAARHWPNPGSEIRIGEALEKND